MRADILELLPAHRKQECNSDLGPSKSCPQQSQSFDSNYTKDLSGPRESIPNNDFWLRNPPTWVEDFKRSSCLVLSVFADSYYKSGSTGQLSSILQRAFSDFVPGLGSTPDGLNDAILCLCNLFKQYIKLKIETDIEEIYLYFRLLKRLSRKSTLFLEAYNIILPEIQNRMASSDTVDRISNLPRNILDFILERLPLDDAARTATLSKTWRNIWVTHPHLIFDDEFISRLDSMIKEEDLLYEIVTTISNILLSHSGPILKFHLFIPGDLPLYQTSMDSWIQNIANNRIRMLEIVNNPVIAYKLPSYLFSCVELTHLQLSNCILNAPLHFRGFRNLISVELSGVLITADMSLGSQLQTLDLRRCTGIKHLGWQFNYNSNLSKLKIVDSDINLQWKNSIFLDTLLRNIPRIHFLCLDGHFLKFLEPDGTILDRPIITMDNLKTLDLVGVGFHDLLQIQYVLCLIRSSPNLQHLSMILQEPKSNFRDDDMESWRANVVEQYCLRLPNLADMNLDKLETVDILGMVGSRCELLFIEFLLASSTSLRWMKLSKNVTINDPKEELMILEDVMWLPRASTTAHIIWN